MAELKPCPFCGKAPLRWYDDFLKKWIVSCENEKCPISPCTPAYKTKGAEVRAWNRRAEDGK